VAEGRPHGKTIIARLQGMTDRDQAARVIGAEIAVQRDQLPVLKPGEYYWADLIGMKVQLADGRSLGEVEAMMETGANDVLVVKGDRQRLIPFIRGQVVREVDMDKGLIQVDWDPDF
jgi:16S rRNA processing protein RimM